jgi:PAS domain S-box-containing protein
MKNKHTYKELEDQIRFLELQIVGLKKKQEEAKNLESSQAVSDEEKYRLLYEFNPIPMSIFNVETLEFLSVNDAFVKKYGYTKEEFLKMTILNIRPNSEKERLEQSVKTIDHGVTNAGVFIHKKRNGELIQVEIIRHDVIFDNKPAKLVLVNDVTDKIKIEHDLLQSNVELILAKEKAEEGDKLKSAFLANMSHEIRTPMNSILGFSFLLKKGGLSDEKKMKYIELIEAGGQRLLTLISDIVDVSKIEANQLTVDLNTFNLNKLIDTIESQFSVELATKEVALTSTTALADNASFIEADEVRLSQILSNLIENAGKFTKKGQIEFGYSIKGKLLQFFVKDTGIGIDKKNLESVFERFKQIDNEYTKSGSGTGLGLSIVKGLIDLLGGNIWVESELEDLPAGKPGGTTFYFSIPYIKAEPTIDSKKLDTNYDINNGKKANILIAEDEISNFLYLEALLEDYPCNVIHAKNGKEAVDIVSNNNSIDLILMDIKMPVMNGFESTKKIRKMNKSIPIIAQTAYALAEDRQNALDHGCNDYLAKPISAEILSKMLRKYIKN